MSFLITKSIRTLSHKASRHTKVPSKTKNPKCGVASPDSVHSDSYKIWRNMFVFLCLPLVGFISFNTFANREEHERPPFVKHEYLRRRTKRFPWGDGDHSLFHNPRINALSEGYEETPDEGPNE